MRNHLSHQCIHYECANDIGHVHFYLDLVDAWGLLFVRVLMRARTHTYCGPSCRPIETRERNYLLFLNMYLLWNYLLAFMGVADEYAVTSAFLCFFQLDIVGQSGKDCFVCSKVQKECDCVKQIQRGG